MKSSEGSVTQLLEAWNAGDRSASARIMPLVYEELRAIARSYFLRERANHTLQATAIVHEAYVKLIEQSGIQWKNRGHFIGMVAHMMRRILVDYTRQRDAAKRGGDIDVVSLAHTAELASEREPDLLALDEALADLERVDPLKVAIVELRFFGGMTIEETAAYLGISSATVVRQWRHAKLWLFVELNGRGPERQPECE